MIEEEFFLGFPFPWLLRSKTGLLIARGSGSLFPLSEYANVSEETDFLLTVGYGWVCCPSGYAAYMSSLSTDENIGLVVYGLKVGGISSRRGRERALSIRLEKDDVEAYVKRSIEALRQSKEKLNLIMRTNIHEVRSINADIYNAVYRLKMNLESSMYVNDRDFPIVRNIEELSEILKTRTDVLDVLSNPALLEAARSSVPIYRAFDRVIHCLKSTAFAERVHLNLTGTSTGRVNGISLFDVIPYLVIQNAIKYAPLDTSIEIRFSEDSSRVYVQVTSMGPAIDDDEIEKIFFFGFRGKFARRAVSEGTGFGMYLLKLLVEMHEEGAIEVCQERDMRRIGQVPYRTTYVRISMNLEKKMRR